MSRSTPELKLRRRGSLMRYDKVFGLLLISPWLIGLIIFKLVPILASLGISFTDFHMLTPEETQFLNELFGYDYSEDCDDIVLATDPVQMWGDDVTGYFKTKAEYEVAFDKMKRENALKNQMLNVEPKQEDEWVWSNGSTTWPGNWK